MRSDFWTRCDLESTVISDSSIYDFIEPFGARAIKSFFIEKKNGSKIGLISYFNSYLGFEELLEIGYNITPNERGRGYSTEAAQIMVDYLFLSRDVNRIQATISIRNKASERVLEKVGFTREGTIRKHVRGERRDYYLYSILGEEWKEPKILTKTT